MSGRGSPNDNAGQDGTSGISLGQLQNSDDEDHYGTPTQQRGGRGGVAAGASRGAAPPAPQRGRTATYAGRGGNSRPNGRS